MQRAVLLLSAVVVSCRCQLLLAVILLLYALLLYALLLLRMSTKVRRLSGMRTRVNSVIALGGEYQSRKGAMDRVIATMLLCTGVAGAAGIFFFHVVDGDKDVKEPQFLTLLSLFGFMVLAAFGMFFIQRTNQLHNLSLDPKNALKAETVQRANAATILSLGSMIDDSDCLPLWYGTRALR